MNSAVHNFPAPGSVISVSSLNRLVRDCLEASLPLTWISGEISNLTYASSGHVYFSLKDASAQVRCVMWRNKAQLLAWRLENGQKIEARALPTLYEPRGDFQLNVEAIRRTGQGDLFERFLQLKARLEAEGLFASSSKRPLPTYPRSLAIVTSPQAAALRDVLSTLKRRAPQLELSLYPSPVQGEGAGRQLAQAVAQAALGNHDAIILCRGGGSIEDLWAFNEEVLARAIRASRLPVISGVGHETDFTIADFAADLRAPTPTAAAELACPDRLQLSNQLDALYTRLQRRCLQQLADRAQALDWSYRRLRHPIERIQLQKNALEALRQRLSRGARSQIGGSHQDWRLLANALIRVKPDPIRYGEQLKRVEIRLKHTTERKFSALSTKLNAIDAGLTQLNPHAVLERGYALAIGPDGLAVRDAEQLSPGDTLNISFRRGSVRSTVTQVVAEEEAT